MLDRSQQQPLGSLQASAAPGLFVGHFPTTQPYVLRIQWAGDEQISEDPYSFGPLLGEVRLSRLTAPMVRAFADRLLDAGRSRRRRSA